MNITTTKKLRNPSIVVYGKESEKKEKPNWLINI